MTEETPVVQYEVEPTPEELMRGLTARVDRGLNELGVPPRNERDWGWCNFVPDAVNYCATRDGEEKGYEVMAAKYQARDLHTVAAGKPTLKAVLPEGWSWDEQHDSDLEQEVQERIRAYYADPVVKEAQETSFGHGFNVITINGESFLLDLSFSQFMGEDGTISRQADNVSSGIPNDDPLAQQILHDGFIPLTDENLRTYMRFLCSREPEYLQHVTTDLLMHVPELPFAMDDNELMDRIPSSYGGTITSTQRP